MQYTVFMKILIISNLYPPYILGGYEILCAQVVGYLEERGHEVKILTSNHESSENTPQITRTLQVYHPFSEPARFSRRARVKTARHNHRETVRAIGQTAPEVIFIWSLLRLTPAPARAAEASGLPVVYTFNDENIAGFLPAPFSLKPKAAVRWFLDAFITPGITLRGIRLSCTTCISKLLKRNLTATGLAIPDSRIIYQGIPLEQFPPRETLGTMGKPVRILYAGQLHPYKGVHTLIKALGLLKSQTDLPESEGAHEYEELPEFSITIAGKGPEEYTASLHESSVNFGVDTTFAGLVPHREMGAVYRNHDIFVFPSIWEEPFGLTHIEAMASGLAVVSTANGGQGEFLRHRENALIFPPDDEKALAASLRELMTDPELYAKLANGGRATAAEEFSFSRYVDELEKLLIEAHGS